MLALDITIHDKALFEAIERVQRLFVPAGQQAVFEEWARRARSLIKVPYPAHTFAPLPLRYSWNDGKLHKFKSLRAQRGFFAAIADGRAKVPYQRKNDLNESFEFHLAVTNGEAVLTASLADRGGFKWEWLVGREDQQSLYFRKYTNWQPLEKSIKQPPLYDELTDAFRIAFETIFEDLKL